MICKHCGVNVTVDDLQGVEGTLCSNSSTCKPCVELANHENAIARLEMKQCELKRKINRSHSLFIRIFPPEIIAKISEFANTDFTIIGRLRYALLLLSICSDWRRIVLETPQLWSSIKIDLPSESMLQTSDMASSRLLRLAIFIDEWLSRSGQLPLNISLCYGYGVDPLDDETPTDPLTLEQYRPIFKILNQYSSRWHNLNISIPPTLLPFLQPDCLPLLEQLHFTSEYHLHHLITFPPTPRLHTVDIQRFMNFRFLIPSKTGIQWGTVTHVSAGSISSRSCVALLLLSPQLVHCTFYKVFDGVEDHFEDPIVSQLTYFSLHHQSDRPYRVLDNLKLPSLETLALFNVTIDPVIAFIERSACSLHTLSLLNWQRRKTDKLIPLLQFLSPNLKRLAISRLPSPMRGTRNYLSLLIRIYTSQSEVEGNDFLPHLEIFEYREESPSTLESSMLLNLPSQNYVKPTTSISLRSAYISKATLINKYIPREISPIIQRLQEDGILTYT